MKSVTIGLLALGCPLLAATPAFAAPAPARPPPNFLVIIADDLGWNDVGYHGSEIRTPNIDRLARESAELNRFYVYPTCSPTRAAFVTGRYPGRAGILSPLSPTESRTLPAGSVTLGAILHESGYDTALIGKWHLGARPADGPRRFGFDHSYGMLHGAVDKYTHRASNGDLTWHRDDQLLEEPGHADDLITEEAIRFLNRSAARAPGQKTSPFYLHVAFGHVHLPFQEEARWTAPYEKSIESPSRRLYAGSVAHMDHNIGRLLAALHDAKLDEDTLVVFFSDNGGIKGPYHWSGAASRGWYNGKFAGPVYDKIGDNRPLRGGKGAVYEGGVRVPALARWPGRLAPGRVEQVMAVTDLFPTLVGLAGGRVPGNLDGIDVWPHLTRRERALSRTLLWQTPSQLALRHGDWKLVHHGGSAEKGKNELYNLGTDPGEEKDLAGAMPERCAELGEELRRILPPAAGKNLPGSR